MPALPRILILCTGNSCRSQMAEGWLRQLGTGVVEVQSAGLEAHGKNPRAIAAMSAAGVDISTQESTVVSDEMMQWADLLITVCGHADEHCPVATTNTEKRHVPFDDPAKAQGSEDEIMADFCRVRDEIKIAMQTLIDEKR